MDLIYIILLFLAVFFFLVRRPSAAGGGAKNLPPGPTRWPVVGNLLQIILQRRQFNDIIPDLNAKYGPIFSLKMGLRTVVIVTSPDLIHEALVQKGEIFASRPPDSPVRNLFSLGKCTTNSAEYGPLWRFLRRNLVNELANPNRVSQFELTRKWAVERHMDRLRDEASRDRHVEVMSHCRLTLTALFVCLCFGVRLSDDRIKPISRILDEALQATLPNLTDFFPALAPLFRRPMAAAKELRRKQLGLMVPLIRNRKVFVEGGGNSPAASETAYVDSLFKLEAPGRGKLGEEEMVSLCTEVIVGGTDTTAAIVEWAMQCMVQNQEMQKELYTEIAGCVGPNGRRVTESDIPKMPFLVAVIKETMRLHPPLARLLPHAASKDTELGGYRIPAGVNVEMYIPLLSEEPKLWQNPSEFRPERFLTGDGVTVDLTGARGVKMLPFGAGRRICPAWSIGTMHASLLLANMVHAFKWIPVPDNPPDPTPFNGAVHVIKNPLKAIILPRN